jgi:uncharacterized protein (TIGR03118 family)
MNRNPSRCAVCHNGRWVITRSFLVFGALVATTGLAPADSYQLSSLTTDDNSFLVGLGFPSAANVDPNLINPWGVSFTSASPFWVSDNGTGVSTLYNGAGAPQSLVVTVAPPLSPPPGFVHSTPTGQVRNNNSSAFGGTGFIFATEDGTISTRSSGTQSVIAVDSSANGAVYKGLAIGTSSSGPVLYAANFNSGRIEVYNSSFQQVNSLTIPSPSLPQLPVGTPAGQNWAPFNVQVLNNQLYVSYALQDAAHHDDVAGPGNGFVANFDLNGNFIGLLIHPGPLNSPWGLDIAPANFGAFSNDLLVGNFGDGTIDAFNPTTGAFLGQLPFVIGDLWALVNGNNGIGSNPDAVYFTAGLMDESHGLFGSITAVPGPVVGAGFPGLAAACGGLFAWWRRRRKAACSRSGYSNSIRVPLSP